MLNVVLVEPEIPQNTGNIARTCACTATKLHLVKPLGFDVSEKALRRAGLDYWDKVEIVYYDNLDDFSEKTRTGLSFTLPQRRIRLIPTSFTPTAALFFSEKRRKAFPKTLFLHITKGRSAYPCTGRSGRLIFQTRSR